MRPDARGRRHERIWHAEEISTDMRPRKHCESGYQDWVLRRNRFTAVRSEESRDGFILGRGVPCFWPKSWRGPCRACEIRFLNRVDSIMDMK